MSQDTVLAGSTGITGPGDDLTGTPSALPGQRQHREGQRAPRVVGSQVGGVLCPEKLFSLQMHRIQKGLAK